MGDITTMVRKSRVTSVVIVCAAFIAVDLGVVLPIALKEAQTKARTEGLDGFDFALLAVAILACVGKTIASFMNKSFARWADERDAEHKEEKRKSGGTTPPDPTTVAEGHLR